MARARLAQRSPRTVLALAAGALLLGAGTAQAAPVTVGSPLTATFSSSFGGTATEANFALGEPGALTTAPDTGATASWTIVSYRVLVDGTGRYAIRVIHPAGGGDFTGGGTSGPATPIGMGLQSFSANLPISAGDLVGLDLLDSSSSVEDASPAGSTVYEWGNNGFLADGQTAPPANVYLNSELGFNADLVPTNTFTVGTTQRNKKKGTASVNVTVPNPGDLSASGNGVKPASGHGATISKAVGAGATQLLIKATGKKKRNLAKKGKAKLNVTITYTPRNGDPKAQSMTVKLKKKR
jgi:hypothetical protein